MGGLKSQKFPNFRKRACVSNFYNFENNNNKQKQNKTKQNKNKTKTKQTNKKQGEILQPVEKGRYTPAEPTY